MAESEVRAADVAGGKQRRYRVVQNEGKTTWRIEELWDGGVVRSLFTNREYAIRREEKIAEEEGFIDELVLVD